MADGTLKVGTITNSAGSGNITIGSGVTVNVNRPAFHAYLGSNQTVADATATKLNINTKVFDTDSCYDTHFYRFTPTEAGKYFVYGNAEWYSTGNTFNFGAARIYKNGSLLFSLGHNGNASGGAQEGKEPSGVVDMNGSTDYLEIFIYVDVSSGTPRCDADTKACHFKAFRIGS